MSIALFTLWMLMGIDMCHCKLTSMTLSGHTVTVVQAKDYLAKIPRNFQLVLPNVWRHRETSKELVQLLTSASHNNANSDELHDAFFQSTKYYICSLAYVNDVRHDTTNQFTVQRVELIRRRRRNSKVVMMTAQSDTTAGAGGDEATASGSTEYSPGDRALPIVYDKRMIGAVFFRSAPKSNASWFRIHPGATGCVYHLTHITHGGTLSVDVPEFTVESRRFPWIRQADVRSLPLAPPRSTHVEPVS